MVPIKYRRQQAHVAEALKPHLNAHTRLLLIYGALPLPSLRNLFWGARLDVPLMFEEDERRILRRKKGLNGRRTKTSKRKAPKRTEKTETVSAKNRKRTKNVLQSKFQSKAFETNLMRRDDPPTRSSSERFIRTQ